MHQRLYGSCHKAVDDEEVLLDAEFRIQAFKVAGMVVLDAMAQHQVLRARWSANRIGLHKAQFVEGAFQRSGCEEAPGDGEAPQVVEFNQHDQILPKVRGVITRRPWFISRAALFCFDQHGTICAAAAREVSFGHRLWRAFPRLRPNGRLALHLILLYRRPLGSRGFSSTATLFTGSKLQLMEPSSEISPVPL